MSEPFQTDRDTVRSASVAVNSVALDSRGNATFTTTTPHGFAVGWQVTVEGAGNEFDGTWYIASITSNTFTVSILQAAISLGTQPGLAVTAVAYSPAPAYVRFDSRDATLSAIGTYVTLRAIPWDYNTVRISWSADSAVEEVAQKDVSAGLTPRVCIVRSSFGYPSTPLDGVQILNEKFVDAIPSITRSARIGTGETQPANTSNAFNRPNAGLLALYDRNLASGRWHYYSIFFLLKGDSVNDPYWRLATSVDALTPINYENGKKLYELLPPYYRYRDLEFAPGRGRKGDLERLINTIGFELDYTRTLAEGIEHLYDIDYVNDELLKYLGEGNFGVPNEGGLGDIRYRSLLAAISRLYDERGSSRGLEEMTFAASKYRCKVLEGINLMNLTDDAEFAESTGAWANPIAVPTYQSWAGAVSGGWIQGDQTGSTSSTFSTNVSLTVEKKTKTSSTAESSASLVPRRNMLRVSASSVNTRILIACGLGEGGVQDRMHASNVASFQPRTHGIRCVPGYLYSFSAFTRLVYQQTAGKVGIGIIWFNEPQNGVFATSDYISKSESTAAAELAPANATSTAMNRLTVTSKAPLSSLGQPFVYAVPYLVFSNGSARLVSACMFYEQLNTVQQQTAAPLPQPTLTLGVTTEKLASEYKLGD